MVDRAPAGYLSAAQPVYYRRAVCRLLCSYCSDARELEARRIAILAAFVGRLDGRIAD